MTTVSVKHSSGWGILKEFVICIFIAGVLLTMDRCLENLYFYFLYDTGKYSGPLHGFISSRSPLVYHNHSCFFSPMGMLLEISCTIWFTITHRHLLYTQSAYFPLRRRISPTMAQHDVVSYGHDFVCDDYVFH